jgi:branched-chain amino acid transport system ATP-binding protein
MSAALLQVENASKRFGGLLAVDSASLEAETGRITGLIGPNGAGKTTLFALISGFETPSGGAIRFRADTLPARLRVRAKRGSRTFQIAVLRGPSRSEHCGWPHLRHRSATRARCAEAVAASSDSPTGSTRRGPGPIAAQTIPGSRARRERPRVLSTRFWPVWTSGSRNPPIITQIGRTGIAIVMVEHVMQAVMSLCERVYVLAQGRIIAQGNPVAVTRDRRVVEAYLGAGAAARLAARRGADG